VGAAHALLVLLPRRHAERLLELLQERLRLQLGLDRDLVGERDEEAAALDQPADDVFVAALDHGRRLTPWAPSAAASSRAPAPWPPPPRPGAPCRPPGRSATGWCARARRRASARRASFPPRSPRGAGRARCTPWRSRARRRRRRDRGRAPRGT